MTLCLFPLAIPLTMTLGLPETPFNLPLRFFTKNIDHIWTDTKKSAKKWPHCPFRCVYFSLKFFYEYFPTEALTILWYGRWIGYKVILLLKSYLFDLFLVKKGCRYDWYIWVAIFRTERRDFARDDLDGLINSHVQKSTR